MSIDGTARQMGTFAKRALVAGWFATTATLSFVATGHAEVQQGHQALFDIPSGSLTAALTIFSRQTGLQVSYKPEFVANKHVPALRGTMRVEQALEQLLSQSGLNYRFSVASTVTVVEQIAQQNAVSANGDTIMLNTITVSKANPVDAPYNTTAPVSYISADTIEHYRGSSPADIFRGTPGVMSGEARNGAGSVDVNIRGMQGMGRVNVTVDGAENSLQVYQGYQGISNRTYVDPDLLAGVEIKKGSDTTSSGIAGSVAMRTVSASDIVKDGERFGLRIKGTMGGNSSKPHAGAKSGYYIYNDTDTMPIVSSSSDGMDRPSFLKPTQGSGSIVAAMQDDNYDFLAGYAYRKRGNYHAGKHGPSANPVHKGPRPFCYSDGTCVPTLNYPDYVENDGLANYRAGEEVLNTELETKSWLTKAGVRFDGGHSVQFGYTGFRSESGDLLASQLSGNSAQELQKAQTSGTRLDSGTFKYRWNPDDNDLINLTSNLWLSKLALRNPSRTGYGTQAGEKRTGSNTTMWGGDVANISSFETGYGAFTLKYGGSYKYESTRPTEYSRKAEQWLNLRDASREEAAIYANVDYKPIDWLTVKTGLRYSHFWSHDRSDFNDGNKYKNPVPERNDGGISPFIGVVVEPLDNTQLYVNYSNAMRSPSLFESVSAFTIIPNADISPERSSNWELGANHRMENLLMADDSAMFKFGYFNWNVKDYIARSYREFDNETGGKYYGMQVYNIDRAKFSGLEFSARYESGGFAAELAANYYLNVAFCQIEKGCDSKSMYGDYATNQVPPKYAVNLTMSQKMLEDRLTVGGRMTYNGKRAIKHGQVTGQGMSQFITMVDWKPYLLVDVFADYKLSEQLTASFRVENLTDKYYIDPLSLINVPAPGRTFYASLTAQF